MRTRGCLATFIAVGLAGVVAPVNAQECEIQGTAASAVAEQAINEGLEARSQQAAQSDFQTALATVEEEMSSNPNNPPPAAIWIAGRANLRLGHYVMGDSLLSRIVNLKPGCEQYANQVREQVWAQQFNAGVEEAEAGDMMAALRHFENANTVWSDARSLSNAASIFEDSGMLNSAENRYQQALEVAETEEARSSAQSGLERISREQESSQAAPSTQAKTSSDGASEHVNGFHGYKWGTPLGEISEVAGTQPVTELDGLDVYTAEISLLGTEGTAWFMVDP